MSTATAPTVEQRIERSGSGIPLGRLVRVELRKSYDTSAGFWLLLTMGILVLAVYTIQLIVGATQDGTHLDYNSFIQGAVFPISFLLPVLGILLVTGEWSQRTALTTFTLVPHRSRILAAKALAGVVWSVGVVAFALVAALLANLLNGALDGGALWRFGVSDLVGFLLYMTLSMLTGFAIAALLLNSPAAIVAYFGITLVLPTLLALGMSVSSFLNDVLPWIDFAGAQQRLTEFNLDAKDWGQLLVSGFIWLVIPLVLGIRRILTTEIK